MKFGYYIAKKLSTSKQQTFTTTITRLAIAAVSVSICVVILSFGILLGFKKEIREKVTGYAGDIVISQYQLSNGNEQNTFDIDKKLIAKIKNKLNVDAVFPIIQKAGIVKSDSVLEGLIFKGVPYNYDFSFFEKHLKKGKLPVYADSTDSYDILLSEYSAQVLSVDTGSTLNLFFIDDSDVRRRRPKVVGIYNTSLQEFDKQFAIGDFRMLQRIVSTDYKVTSSLEVKVNNFNLVDGTSESINEDLDYKLGAKTVKEMYPTIFQWLEIVDTNVLVIIILMFIVAIINMFTVLLILIIDRIPMIGLLKAMGSGTTQILSIFNWQGLFILVGGVLIGNAVALTAAFLQNQFKLIKLSADTYYMDSVPFYLPWYYLVIINIVAIVICYIFTYLPLKLIAKITPSDSIRFR
jgi:lipoprotein-releasing system permease protein